MAVLRFTTARATELGARLASIAVEHDTELTAILADMSANHDTALADAPTVLRENTDRFEYLAFTSC